MIDPSGRDSDTALVSDPTSVDIAELGDAVIAAAAEAGLGVLVLLTAPDIKIVYVSPAAAVILDRTPEEILRARPLEFIASDALPDAIAHLEALHAGRSLPTLVESRVVRRDGTTLPVKVGVGRAELAGRRCAVTFISDLTDWEKAAAELRRSESRWRALIESAPDAIVISRERRIVYANPAAVALLGYESAEAMVGQSFADFLHEEDYRTMAERVGILFAGGGPLGPHEYRARSRDGRAIVVEVTSILFEDENGPAVIGFARDVTHSRTLQAQLMLADRLAGLGTMAAGVAHEINNPLAFMMLGLEAIEREIARPSSEQDALALHSTLADVRHGVERITTIVRQLRAFSRPADANARAVADLAAVVDSAARMAAHEIRPLGTITVRVEGDLSPVRGEPSQLEQVFLNLFLNASQALDETRGDGRVEVIVQPVDEASVEVLVRDNGLGIAERDLAHVFDPFFTTKPLGLGTGLGLSICHSIVSAAGGDIQVESRAGEGTTVRVVLPVLRAALTRRSTPAQPPRRDALRRLRVLVADDEPAFVRALERLFGPLHEVVTAEDGEEAWARLEETRFDVILLDVMMPVLSGMDLFERIRAERPELVERVGFVTGGGTRERVERFLAKVGRPILKKPFDEEKARALLRRLAPK